MRDLDSARTASRGWRPRRSGRRRSSAHGLDEAEADPPGGEQRLERPLVEVPDDRPLQEDADQRGGQKGDRDRHQQIEPRAVHDRLHGVGRVGAQHQHLAVGHVDDAQEAEGDGQAERREQQHAGQRQAVQQIAHEADHALMADDGVAGVRGGGPHPRVRLARLPVVARRQHLLQRRKKVVVAALARSPPAPPSRAFGSALARSTRAIASVSASWTLPSCSRSSARWSSTGACASPPFDSSLAAASRTACVGRRRARAALAPARPPAGSRC